MFRLHLELIWVLSRPVPGYGGDEMRAFTTHTSLAAILDRDDVDTDQVIPKQFLKRITRTGYDDALFFDGSPNADFELNHPVYEGASILIAGRNFGSGSSCEHAPWALNDYGFRAIIVPSFADIFRNNCFQNDLLTITLDEADVRGLREKAAPATTTAPRSTSKLRPSPTPRATASPSRSTTSAATPSSTASTTSAWLCSTRTRSRPTSGRGASGRGRQGDRPSAL